MTRLDFLQFRPFRPLLNTPVLLYLKDENGVTKRFFCDFETDLIREEINNAHNVGHRGILKMVQG